MFGRKSGVSSNAVADVRENSGFALYGVYDVKAYQLVGGTIYTFPTDAVACRMFIDSISNPESVLARHPEDYCLVKIGFIDYETLSVKSYGVGFSDPVMTGVGAVRAMQKMPVEMGEVDESEVAAVTAALVD